MGFFKRLLGLEAPPPRTPRPFTPITDDSIPGPSGGGRDEPLYDSVAARQRSLMHKQPTMCDGEKTGHQCRWYFTKTEIPSSATADHLLYGERFHGCRVFGDPDAYGEGKEGMAPECSMYEADEKRLYNPSARDYTPAAPEEIAAIQRGEITSFEDLHAFRAKKKAEAEAAAAEAAKNPIPDAEGKTLSIDDVVG